MTELFISYSRRDKEFVQRFIKALSEKDYPAEKIWIDWEDIPPSSKWEDEIGKGIEQAYSAVFILSPNWGASVECAKELQIAAKFNKRLFPVVYQNVDPKVIPSELASLNWIFFRDTDNFEEALEKLISAMNTDLGWVQQHTNILSRSIEWESKGRDNGYLLRGNELQEAETWLSHAADEKQPRPTALQSEYIYASRQDAIQRQRRTLIGVSVMMAISIVLAISAVVAGVEAVRQSRKVQATQLSAQSTNLVGTQPDLSLLLSLESNYIGDELNESDPAWEGSLITSLNSSPHLETYLRFHSDQVRAVAFSPDGKWLVSAGRDAQVALWDMAASGSSAPAVFTGASQRILAVAFSADGELIAAAGDDRKIFVWDAQKCCSPLVEIDVSDSVRALAFVKMKNSELVAIASGHQVTFWDVDSKKMEDSLTLQLPNSEVRILSLAVTRDGSALAAGSDDANITVWDLSTGEIKFQECSYQDEANDPLVCRDPGEGQTDIRGVAFNADGSLLASGSADQRAWLWDANSGDLLARSLDRREGGHQNSVVAVEFDPKGRNLATASWDNTVKVWQINRDGNGWSFRLDKTLVGHASSVWALAYDASGRRLASGSADDTVILWNLNQVSQIGRVVDRLSGDVWALATSTKGDRFAAGDSVGNIRVWDFDGQVAHESLKLKHDGGVLTVAFSHDGKWLASAGYDKTIRVWDLKTGVEAWRIDDAHKDEIWSVAFSPNDQWIASASFDQTARVWNVSTHKPVGDPLEHPRGVFALAFSADGSRLYVAGYAEDIYVWDTTKLNTTQEPVTLEGHAATVNNLFVNPVDSAVLASTSDDKTLLVWNVNQGEHGEHTAPVLGLNESMEAVVFRPDGDWLASATDNNTVLLWYWAARECAQKWDVGVCQPSLLGSPLVGHHAAVRNLVFLSDTKLVSSGADGELILWNLDKGYWYKQACKMVHRDLDEDEKNQYLARKGGSALLDIISWFSNLFVGGSSSSRQSCA